MKSFGIKYWLFFSAAAALVGISNPLWGCGLKQGIPHEHFTDVNSVGKLSYWLNLDQIDLGNGLSLPLNINFKANRKKRSPYLGKGWMLPFLEQNFVERNEKVFVMREPNGYVLPFRRAKGDVTLLRGREGWMARIKDDHTIEATASCGWVIDFTDGKISEMHTPDNRTITFNYRQGIVTRVDIEGTPLLTVNIDGQSKKITGLSYNGKEVSLEEGRRPMVHHQHGKLLVARIAQSLHKVILSDGKSETFEFGVDDKMKPTLKVTGSDNHLFTWSPRTKCILKDGDWTYKTVVAHKKDRAIRGGRRFANAQIQRTDSKGRTESWFRDLKNGTTTIQKLDGTKIVKERFVGSGLAGKMRSVEKSQGGKTVSLFQGTYDNNKQLVRKLDGKGNVFEWKTSGNTRTMTENNAPVRATTFDASGRPVSEVDTKTRIRTSYNYLAQGGYQEIINFPNGQRFVQTIDAGGKTVEGHYVGN
jgi:hypothetical protein